MLSYKVVNAGKASLKVNSRGTSEGLTFNDPYRDYTSANRIKDRGWDSSVNLWRENLYSGLYLIRR